LSLSRVRIGDSGCGTKPGCVESSTRSPAASSCTDTAALKSAGVIARSRLDISAAAAVPMPSNAARIAIPPVVAFQRMPLSRNKVGGEDGQAAFPPRDEFATKLCWALGPPEMSYDAHSQCAVGHLANHFPEIIWQPPA
jgi:hypothetical protein